MKLREYQTNAVDEAARRWLEDISTLVVMPTGGGKTLVFAEAIRRALPKRAMVLAHREQLLFQARDKIERIANIECGIEMAEMNADTNLFTRNPCVLATVQTMHRRLERFDPMSFGLVIVDEAHHATASSYVKILNHFKKNPNLKILGVTATPDRADEEAMGQIFDSVAYDYEILDAINDGWLVPVEQQFMTIGTLDFSSMRTTAGDLNGADLAQLMEAERNLQGVCGSSIEIIGDRQSILFASSVKHADMACEIFNRHRAGMATFVSGETDREERRIKLAKFKAGEIQVLCNVGIATEGSDFPDVAVVLMARPTKSRSLYAQMAGRGMRPLEGLVDSYESPDERRLVIASSIKPACLLVDFVGNSGKHKLMTSADILGGKVSDEAVELALKKVRNANGAVRMVEIMQEAEDELKKKKEAIRIAEEARKSRVVARVQYTTRKVNPFDVLDISPVKERGWDRGKRLTDKQASILTKQGIDGRSMPYAQANQLLQQIFKRWHNGQCSYKQAALLKKHGYDGSVTRQEASKIIDALAKNGWRKPDSIISPIEATAQETPPEVSVPSEFANV